MQVDGTLGNRSRQCRPRCPGARSRRLHRRVDRRDGPRPVPPAPARRRAHHRAPARHVDRGRLRPQPDDARQHRLGPAALLRRAVHARTRQPDQAAHHQALLDGVEPPRAADARDGARHPGDLGHVGERHPAAVPRRVLHAHVDDAVLRAGCRAARRLRRAEDLPRRSRRADDRGGRRGLRRVLLPRVHHREVPPRGHAAGARTRAGEGRQDARRLRDRRPVVRRHGQRRGGDGRKPRPAPASRSRSTARPRPTARCSRCTAGAVSRIA